MLETFFASVDWPSGIVGLVIGGSLTWLTTHVYYKKSKSDLKNGFAEQLSEFKAVYEAQLGNSSAKDIATAALWDSRLNRAIQEHRRLGTAQLLIDAYVDYSKEQKAALWDAVGKAIRPEGFARNPFKEG